MVLNGMATFRGEKYHWELSQKVQREADRIIKLELLNFSRRDVGSSLQGAKRFDVWSSMLFGHHISLNTT